MGQAAGRTHALVGGCQCLRGLRGPQRGHSRGRCTAIREEAVTILGVEGGNEAGMLLKKYIRISPHCGDGERERWI